MKTEQELEKEWLERLNSMYRAANRDVHQFIKDLAFTLALTSVELQGLRERELDAIKEQRQNDRLAKKQTAASTQAN